MTYDILASVEQYFDMSMAAPQPEPQPEAPEQPAEPESGEAVSLDDL